jgi:hypothetical protein
MPHDPPTPEEEEILSAPGPGAYRAISWSNPDGVRTGYAVYHVIGPAKMAVHLDRLFYEQAEAERHAALQDRMYGRPLLRTIDARLTGLPSQEEADRYLDDLAGTEHWGPRSDPYAVFAHVLWEYDAQDTYDDDGNVIAMDEGLGSVPTLAQVVAWLARKQE